jgi:hypothetical protein
MRLAEIEKAFYVPVLLINSGTGDDRVRDDGFSMIGAS